MTYKTSLVLKPTKFHYCSGCGHGIIHRLIANVIDELNIQDRVVGIAPVGCAVLLYNYLDIDIVEVAHGRAPAVATGIKRTNKDLIVFTYQGDGDLAAIGTAEIIHAAARAENITTIFVNNATYGMTGGQMAPTTLIDQKTTTTPYGRQRQDHGFPLKICELLSTIDGTSYIARFSVHNPKDVRRTYRGIKEGFIRQGEGRGFSLVEILSQCPICWGLSPIEACKWIETQMKKIFPLGIFKS